MDAEQFLSRVVAPGNFIAIGYGSYNIYRFFDRSRVDQAAAFVEDLTARGQDSWYACAAYRFAEQKHGHLEGKRDKQNVQLLKTLWVDLDVKREGDGKIAGVNVFADVATATAWFAKFIASTNLPIPNLSLSSGYGRHVYWVLDQALSPQQWQPYADALRSALTAHGATMDVSVTVDSARILRIPGTYNLKDRANPAPVQVIHENPNDIENQLVYDALAPFMGAAVASLRSGTGSLPGSQPAVIQLRQGQGSTTSTTQAAHNITRREWLFSEIGTKCKQVELSLSTGGLGDLYPLWYLGFISLASFCSDGATYAHEIGKGDPRYTVAGTDAALALTARERQTKRTGAPTCAHFDKSRAGVCQTCPHYGRLNSPVSLGTEGDDGDLPERYIRKINGIYRKTTDDKGKPVDKFVVHGDVYNPILDQIGDDRKITFSYDKAGSVSTVQCLASEIPTDPRGAIKIFGLQGIGLFDNAREFGRFLVAWIDKLRDMRAERTDPVPPFGWAVRRDGTYNGFSVGGTIYRPDGSQEPAPGGDPEINQMYQPRGTLADWRVAVDFVTLNRVDLQIIVAASFAAPLVEFTGHSGLVMSMWSRTTALGKSSAMQAGISVWADPKGMFNFDDTPNSVHYRIGRTKTMPAYWDEIRVTKDNAENFIDTLFKLGQGKDKARLNSDSSLKKTGDWKTILVTSGNRPLMDFIVREKSETDAGAVRLFEICMDHPQLNLDPGAQKIIAQAGKNSGNAGRVYAKWLGANAEMAQKFLTAKQTQLGAKLGANQGERFYITTISTLLVGAAIANHLGLGRFDIGGMEVYLSDAFRRLRKDRTGDLHQANGFLDLDKILAGFMTDTAPERMYSKHWKRPGRPSPKDKNTNTIWFPRKPGGRIAVQISKFDRAMRINKEAWDQYLYHHQTSFSDIFHQMEMKWGARLGKGVLGADTDWVTGRIAYIEMSIAEGTELEVYNYDPPISGDDGLAKRT